MKTLLSKPKNLIIAVVVISATICSGLIARNLNVESSSDSIPAGYDIIELHLEAKGCETPSVSPNGNDVVFISRTNGLRVCYIYNVESKNLERLTDDNQEAQWPQVNENYVLWSQTDRKNGNVATDGRDVMVYYRKTNEKKFISKQKGEEVNPQLFSNYAVWLETNGRFNDSNALWACNLSTDEIVLAKEKGYSKVSGYDMFNNILVWSDNSEGDFNIYMYDFNTKTKKVVCDHEGDQIVPKINGTYIIWTDTRNVANDAKFNYDLYGCNLLDLMEFEVAVNPVESEGQHGYFFSNEKIVYTSYPDVKNAMPVLYNVDDNTKETSIRTLDPASCKVDEIGKDRISYAIAVTNNAIFWHRVHNGGEVACYDTTNKANYRLMSSKSCFWLCAGSNTAVWQTLDEDSHIKGAFVKKEED